MANKLYGFSDRQSLHDTIRAVRFALRRFGYAIPDNSPFEGEVYVEVTELVSGSNNLEAKAKLVEQNNGSWADVQVKDPNDNDVDVLFDIDSEATVHDTTNIASDEALTVGEVYKVVYYPGAREDADWFVVRTGGSSAQTFYWTPTEQGTLNGDYVEWENQTTKDRALTGANIQETTAKIIAPHISNANSTSRMIGNPFPLFLERTEVIDEGLETEYTINVYTVWPVVFL